MKDGKKKRVSVKEKKKEAPLEGERAEKEPGEGAKAEEGQEPVKKKIEPLEDRLLRLRADFENFRKRTLREKGELYRRANEDIMLELLTVLDHLDLALKAIDEHKTQEAIVDGVRLVSEQMLSVLKKFGLTPINTGNEPFDPNRHEAISHMASDEIPENMVITQVRRGYMLGNKVLRAAQVVVSSGAQTTDDKGQKSEGRFRQD